MFENSYEAPLRVAIITSVFCSLTATNVISLSATKLDGIELDAQLTCENRLLRI
jgi:hypothetical protein